ncbi:HAD family hydrolase [Fictibacillus sp. 18YEL24]|uniref:HAD family hydrolase n=1 Tax=Fictibacillus sp. 18YEL24 TaxID=2745875 RepID=UPI0018CD2754|nr:HAD family hydrolase [Fictibacillus sp. 18YEL24]MBH0168214.1 HAD family hydrolase [Fictibacillus sp. 18YEL24]
MSTFSLLLLDLDDTLLKNSSWFDDGFTHFIRNHPLTNHLHAPKLLELFKQPPRNLIEKLISNEYSPSAFKRARWEYVLKHFNLSMDMESLDGLDNLFLKTSMDFITVNDAITSLVIDLSRNFELGIVTNGLYDPKQKLVNMGLGEIFSDDKVFHAEQLGYRKPNPNIYLKALEYFDRKPSETLFIGDSWTHDVIAPMEVGMEAIWVNVNNVLPPTSHKPFAIVSDIAEIRDVLLSK